LEHLLTQLLSEQVVVLILLVQTQYFQLSLLLVVDVVVHFKTVREALMVALAAVQVLTEALEYGLTVEQELLIKAMQVVVQSIQLQQVLAVVVQAQ
jgi:hypothetical protein